MQNTNYRTNYRVVLGLVLVLKIRGVATANVCAASAPGKILGARPRRKLQNATYRTTYRKGIGLGAGDRAQAEGDAPRGRTKPPAPRASRRICKNRPKVKFTPLCILGPISVR